MDRLEAAGDQELRTALSYALSRARPITADDLAGEHGIHRNVARSRLERLVDAGLLVSGYERRTGRAGPGAGRPAKTYSVAPHVSPIEFPRRRYEKLVSLVVDALPRQARVPRLRALGTAFADDLLQSVRLLRAKTLSTGAERVCEAMRELGFHATLVEVDGDVAVIETATCPLRPLVRENAELAEIDRGMWAGVTARAVHGADAASISCDTDACHGEGPCRVRLRVLLD
jgi:predicted ArsR family transcriptional regulator